MSHLFHSQGMTAAKIRMVESLTEKEEHQLLEWTKIYGCETCAILKVLSGREQA